MRELERRRTDIRFTSKLKRRVKAEEKSQNKEEN